MTTLAHKPLPALCNSAVRDLAWACFSPPMIDCEALPWPEAGATNCQLELTGERTAWLRALDQDPAALVAFLDQVNGRRLGLYFEALWHFLLQQDPATDLLATNLAVRTADRTIGEFDVIYFCHQRARHVHLELAVKFYLCAPGHNGNAWQHWLGPNARDRLDLKLERMMQHQVMLSRHSAARPVLDELGIYHLDREMEVKGRLYAADTAGTSTPPGWHTQNTIYPYRHQGPGETCSRPSLAPELNAAGTETTPYFIVAPDWPGTAD